MFRFSSFQTLKKETFFLKATMIVKHWNAISLCFNISFDVFIVVNFVFNFYALMDTDIKQIILEAQHRWLRPAEICAILSNHKKFLIASEPAHMPPSMLFLFCQKITLVTLSSQ